MMAEPQEVVFTGMLTFGMARVVMGANQEGMLPLPAVTDGVEVTRGRDIRPGPGRGKREAARGMRDEG